MTNFLTHNLATDKKANSFEIKRIGEEVEDAICCRPTKSVTKGFQTALSKKKLEITHHWKPTTGSTRKQMKTTEKYQNKQQQAWELQSFSFPKNKNQTLKG